MAEKMEGNITELKTYKDGKQVDSEIVFEPLCDWWIGKLHDYLGCTKYDDIGAVIDEFGIDVAERITKGEVVTVERTLSDKEIAEKDLRKVSCAKPFTVEKIAMPIRYPFPGGSKEYLIRRWE